MLGSKKNLASTYNRGERLKMLESPDKYSLKEQCELLGLNRTSLYYKPKPISQEKLDIYNRIDELFTLSPAFGGSTIGISKTL